ncbi:hypothetical protein GW17_00057276 [Ensete ventricosum]|nr:hypothetical protein GW17_00057276 [Ensete ventricosum]
MGGTYRSARLSVHRPSAIGWYSQNRPSAIDFDRWWLIEGEIDRRRSISAVGSRLREKKKKRKRRKKNKRWSIEGEIDHRRSIEGKEERRRRGKEERRGEERSTSFPCAVLARVPSPPSPTGNFSPA